MFTYFESLQKRREKLVLEEVLEAKETKAKEVNLQADWLHSLRYWPIQALAAQESFSCPMTEKCLTKP